MAQNNHYQLLVTTTASLLLLLSLVDISYTSYYIIHCCLNKNLNLPIEATVLLLVNMWFMNNIRLKASIYLFGKSDSDKNVINLAGGLFSSIGAKLQNDNNENKQKTS